jgi:hypothetical protein
LGYLTISPLGKNTQIDQTLLLISRLERLSADSYWAHRASGLRGALLRSLERLESGEAGEAGEKEETAQLDRLFQRGFDILAKAAREIMAS